MIRAYMYIAGEGWYRLNSDMDGLRWGIWFEGPSPRKEKLTDFVKLSNEEFMVQIALGTLPPFVINKKDLFLSDCTVSVWMEQ